MKILKLLIGLATLLSCVVFASGNIAASTSTDSPTLLVDCQDVLGDAESQGPLTLQVMDRTSTPSRVNVRKLFAPACRSSYGAIRQASVEHKDADWVQDLRFIVVDTVQGSTDQAQFQKGYLLSEFPYSVVVAGAMLTSYKENELVWVLGHELGHGIHVHSNTTLEVKLLGIFLGTTCAIGGAVAWSKKRKKLAIGLMAGFVVGVSGIALGLAHLAPSQELDADIFGVKVVSSAGVAILAAKSTATEILQRHPSPAEPFMNKVLPDGHPSSSARIQNIESVK